MFNLSNICRLRLAVKLVDKCSQCIRLGWVNKVCF